MSIKDLGLPAAIHRGNAGIFGRAKNCDSGLVFSTFWFIIPMKLAHNL
jgi:hypothetical protein